MKNVMSALIVLGLLAAPAWAGTVWVIGSDNNSTSEFEQEGGGRNDGQFYRDAGDYTLITGLTGPGLAVASPEPYIDPSILGMPRALTSGFTKLDIFYQMDEVEGSVDNTFRFKADLFSLGTGSSHNLAFFFNGQQFHSLTNIASNRLVDVLIDPDQVNVGANVLSIQRTGGGTTSPWIQFDYLSLDYAAPEPASLALLTLAAGGLASYFRRRR